MTHSLRKRLLLLLTEALLLLSAFGFPLSARAAGVPKAVETAIINSVYVLLTTNEASDPKLITTAYPVSVLDGKTDKFVTSIYLVSTLKGSDFSFRVVRDGASSPIAAVASLSQNKDNGFIILQTETPLSGFADIPFGDAYALREGDELYTRGVPSIFAEEPDGFQISETEFFTFLEDKTEFGYPLSVKGEGPIRYCGAPVVTADGRLVGINYTPYITDDGKNAFIFAVPIDLIPEFTEQSSAPTPPGAQTPTPPPSAKTPKPTPKPTPTPKAVTDSLLSGYVPPLPGTYAAVSTPTPEPTAEPEPKPVGSQPFLIIGGIVLLAALGAAAVLLLRKRGAGNVFVQGQTGQYTGKTIALQKTVRFGRNASACQVVFAQDTEGVSSVHCALTVQGQTVSLTDLGSTYGTFLSDRTKLVPNVPRVLNNGDIFYVGSNKQAFMIIKGGK